MESQLDNTQESTLNPNFKQNWAPYNILIKGFGKRFKGCLNEHLKMPLTHSFTRVSARWSFCIKKDGWCDKNLSKDMFQKYCLLIMSWKYEIVIWEIQMKVWHKYSFPKKGHFVNPLLTVCATSHPFQCLPCYKPREGLLLLPHLLLLLLHVHHDHHRQVLGGRGDPLPLHLQPDPAPVQRHVRLGRDGQFLILHSSIFFLFYHLSLTWPFFLRPG